ncbi:glycosyltransferase family 4 protein [Nodosilinea nodulosa]|uniref:glycosyltransferase family 4 protein n=1 Tax=Nodosilinea nodulosa TaxID=416001 RepID=UPI000308B008|nr:glycosyltransferase [Nodosilinea nodulosa]
MKVLLSAYSCEPGRGSERGVGWNVAREVAKRHEVWVLTRPDESKDAIEAELARNPLPNLHFVYFTLPFWQDSMRWGQSGAMQIHYYLWQIQAYFVAKKLHREIGFDLAHHVTFVKYSSPSFLAFLPIPFIWGPVGGGETAPAPFWQDFSLRARLYEVGRDLVRKLGELDPFARLTAQNSTVVRATTTDTAARLRQMGAQDIQIVPEVGLLEDELWALRQYLLPTDAPVRFISMGRLLHWKGYHLGLRAFAKANLPHAEYWLVGDGPERQTLQAMAQALGIAHRVRFWGRLSREDTLEKLRECHVLVHPSLHDSGGWVCIEGMAAGRPVVCLDLGGPAVQVTAETGFKVAAQTPAQTVHTMAEAMTCLAQDPALRETMGAAGRTLVSENYGWRVVGERLDRLYQATVRPTPVKVS